jgi:hypothetical protein
VAGSVRILAISSPAWDISAQDGKPKKVADIRRIGHSSYPKSSNNKHSASLPIRFRLSETWSE